MEYRYTVYGFDSGLNELLNGVYFDWRTKRVYNREKNKNDNLIIKHLRKNFKPETKLVTPIEVHYKFYVKDKRHDRMNIASAFDKSNLDALQKIGMLKNDGYDDVVAFTFDWEIDRLNPRVEVRIVEVTELADSHEKEAKVENLSTKHKTLSER